ncbi:MAG: anti-sigma factor family protein [Bryobacteraceae bacterium]
MKQHVPEERLALYVSGDLEASGIREHLQTCERCRNIAAELEQTCSLLASVADEPAAENLAEVRRLVLGRLRRPRRAVWTWSAAAALAAGVALACFLEYPAEPPLPAAPQIAAVPAAPQEIAAQEPPERRPQPRRADPTAVAPGIRSVALVSQPDGPPLIKIATTDPHVTILLASDERTKPE